MCSTPRNPSIRQHRSCLEDQIHRRVAPARTTCVHPQGVRLAVHRVTVTKRNSDIVCASRNHDASGRVQHGLWYRVRYAPLALCMSPVCGASGQLSVQQVDMVVSHSDAGLSMRGLRPYCPCPFYMTYQGRWMECKYAHLVYAACRLADIRNSEHRRTFLRVIMTHKKRRRVPMCAYA